MSATANADRDPAVHLVIGPVGAGKTTFARQLAAERGAVSLNLDAWMARLFGADPRPADGVIAWYLERRDRCLDQIWRVAVSVIDAGAPVALEIGLLQRSERAAFYRRVDERGAPLVVYVLDAPIDERRERVRRRNRDRGDTFSVEVPPDFFELASSMWQPPDEAEQAARDVRYPVDVRGAGGELTWIYEPPA